MITVDEAAEILTGKRPSLSNRLRKGAVSLWRDISLTFSAPFRKTIEAIDGRIVHPGNATLSNPLRGEYDLANAALFCQMLCLTNLGEL